MEEVEYSVGFELMNGGITAWSGLENRNPYPFGENEFNQFFQNFFSQSFTFPGYFGCILIYDAKENAPTHSYAIGWMFAEGRGEVNKELRSSGQVPKAIGQIRFEDGGGISARRIRVEKR